MPGFSRQERLKSRKTIARLFSGGTSYMAYPLRVLWLPQTTDENGVQVAIAVPKRHFKTAVQRNRLKRRIREAYRLHKDDLYEKCAAAGQVSLMLMYIAKEELPYREIEAGVMKMIRKFPGDTTRTQ